MRVLSGPFLVKIDLLTRRQQPVRLAKDRCALDGCRALWHLVDFLSHCEPSGYLQTVDSARRRGGGGNTTWFGGSPAPAGQSRCEAE